MSYHHANVIHARRTRQSKSEREIVYGEIILTRSAIRILMLAGQRRVEKHSMVIRITQRYAVRPN